MARRAKRWSPLKPMLRKPGAWGRGFHRRDGRPAALYFDRKRNRASYSVIAGGLTIGNDAVDWGYADGNFGAIEPADAGGFVFNEMSVDASDAFIISFAGGLQITGVDELTVTFPTFSSVPFDTVWNGGNSRYEATVPGLTAFFQLNDGITIPFELTAITPLFPTDLEDSTVLDNSTELV